MWPSRNLLPACVVLAGGRDQLRQPKWNATSRSAGEVVRNRDAISPHDKVRHVRSFQIKGLFGSLGKFVRSSAE